MNKRCALVLALLSLAGCAAKQKTLNLEYVFKPDLLVPPGGTMPSKGRLNVQLGKARLGRARGSSCSIVTETLRLDWKKSAALLDIDIRGTGDPSRLTLTAVEDISKFRNELLRLERTGCLKPGESSILLTRMVESLVLPSRVSYTLRHGNVYTGYVDILPPLRMKIVTPLREGVAVGFETAWYRVERGKLVPERAEKSVKGVLQTLKKPELAVVKVTPGTKFFRIFFLTRRSANDHDILLLTAKTAEELESHTLKIKEDSEGSCKTNAACILVPQGTAIAAELAVRARGTQVYAPISGTVSDVLRSAGVRQMAAVKDLQVTRPYGKTNIPVKPEKEQDNLLGLVLIGGEQITWQ